MRIRLVRPMASKGSSVPQFTQRIPADLKAWLIGQILPIPVGDETIKIKITRQHAKHPVLSSHDRPNGSETETGFGCCLHAGPV